MSNHTPTRTERNGVGPPQAGKYYLQAESGFTTPGAYSSYNTGDIGCFTAVKMTARAKMTRFLKRIVQVRQMDFEFAAWQMLYLLINPQKVYRNFLYRKRTKDQFARDDPAFLVLLSLSLLFSSLLFAVALGLTFGGFLRFFAWVVFVDSIGVGCVVATAIWFFSNGYLRKTRDQDVEWGYCFDVHLNAFFPMLVLLHVALPLIYNPIIDYEGLLPSLIGNSIWFAAFTYYTYITFLGYTAIPFLHKTHYFLYPITFIFIGYVASVTAHGICLGQHSIFITSEQRIPFIDLCIHSTRYELFILDQLFCVLNTVPAICDHSSIFV